MTDTNQLPPLPNTSKLFEDDNNIVIGYTADQMRAYALQARAQVQGESGDLHDAIMNLLCKPENMDAEPNQRLAHKVGHRDARHAAAELVARYTTPQPAQATQAEVMDERHQAVDQIMEQAQVFASAWALVGGRFDSGDALDDAHEAKEELREMVCSAILALRPVQVPMTDDEHNDMICTVTTLCAKLSRQAIAGMAIDWTEAHHGITAQAKKETP